jgi:hypothetical protein
MTGQQLREQVTACEERVRDHLEYGEHVLAVGRSADVTERAGMAGWTFVMVTDQALRWVMHFDLKLEASLSLDSITGMIERMSAHRYTVDLEHRPITRLHHVPAHRFLWFEWGNDFANVSFTRTALEFSRRDTAAAVALGEQLVARSVPVTRSDGGEPST